MGKLGIVRLLVLVAVAAAGVIFANVALLGVARGNEPVGKLSPRLLLTETAPAVREGSSTTVPSEPTTTAASPVTATPSTVDDNRKPRALTEPSGPDD